MPSKHALGMPRMNELGQMSNEELQETLADLRATYMTDKGDTTRGGNPPTGRMRETRKSIARILTIMQKRGVRPLAMTREETPVAESATP